MSTRKTLLWQALCATLLISTATLTLAKGPKIPYDQPGMMADNLIDNDEVHWVGIADIRKSLEGQAPTVVGFDIDDTALVSSQCFFYGKQRWSPNSYDYLHNQEFWNFVADGCDQYSIPKESAQALINMHQKRGDKIIFITGRTPAEDYDGKSLDKLGEILKKDFNIIEMSPVVYTKDTVIAPWKYDKTPYIKENHITIFYGDSDSDILAAREAGARGIRVVRSAVSTNRPLPLNGGYGEEVVINSWY